MRLLTFCGFFALLLTSTLGVYGQGHDLFGSFDCRYHGELVMDDPAPDSLSQAAIDALMAFDEPDYIIEIDTLNGWKNWSTVENFAFGKDRGEMQMITEIDALHPWFRDKIYTLIRECKAKGIELAVVETYRTHAKQNEYKTMGKKYTRSGAGKSKHQYGLAIDVVPIVDDVAVWDNAALWKKIGVTGEKLGLRWGGRWKRPYDPGHFEWTSGISTTSLAAGQLPPLVDQDNTYPCIEEDMRILRRYWTEWETAQSVMTRK